MYDEITERIIGSAYTVANTLGSGFLEKVYENALAHELRKGGAGVRQQHGVNVLYDGVVVGDYVVDLLVDESILVELKAVKALDSVHMAQCMNYLKATGLQVCLLLRFATDRDQTDRQQLVRPYGTGMNRMNADEPEKTVKEFSLYPRSSYPSAVP